MPESLLRAALRRPLFLAAGAGLLYCLGFPPVGAWPVGFAGAAMLVWLLDASESAKDAVARSVVMKLAAVIPTLLYLAGLGLTVHLATAAQYAAGWAFLGLAYWHARRLGGRLAGLLCLPWLWLLGEWLGAVKHFLPSLAPAWTESLAAPGLRVAAATGVLGLSALAAGVAVLPLAVRVITGSRGGRFRAATLAALGLAALWAPLAAGLLIGQRQEPPGPPLRVALLSLDLHDALEKYLEQGASSPAGARAIEAHVRRRVGEFARLLSGLRADLVVLPDDVPRLTLPGWRSREAFDRFGIENNGVVIDAYRELARTVASDLAVGLVTIRQGRRYTTTLFIGRDGALFALRDKWKLTPGSEYWPIPRWLGVWRLFAGDPHYISWDRQYSWPEEPFPPISRSGWRIGASVCLEGHGPEMQLGWRRSGAELLLFFGNSHWFNWDPGAYNTQLLNGLRLASAAYGLPIVMTGKMSYSGAVLPDGTERLWAWPSPGGREEAHLLEIPRSAIRSTLATRWGEYYLPLAAVVPFLLVLAARALRE